MGRAPSFLRSARNIVRYLYNPAGLGLEPELVLDLFDDPSSAGDQLARIRDTLDIQLRERREAGCPVTDVLIYYISHGQTDEHGHLSVLVRRSRRGLEAETGIKAPELARTLRLAAPQQRRSVILDCCFSETAARDFIGMASDLNQRVAATAAKDLKDLGDNQPARGTLLLCSSPVGQVSMGAPNDACTLFTGAVLDVLQRGAEGRPPYLSFADLRDTAYDRMVASFGANAPRPVLHQVNAALGTLIDAPAFPNYAARTETPPTKPQPSPEKKLSGPLRPPQRVTLRLPDAVALFNKGSHLGSLGRNEEAIAAYDDLLARFGNATELPLLKQVAMGLFNKGVTLFTLGHDEEAIAAYDDLLARFGSATELPLLEEVAIALRNKGFALGTLGRNEEAIAAYDDLLARFGNTTELPLLEQAAAAKSAKDRLSKS
jgi:tetratricopeptide (TPR) repeat protein